MEKPRDERYEACLRLFLLHKGLNFCLIEREMRALGYADFNRRILYSRTEKGEYKPGWIERFGWKNQLGGTGGNTTGRECALRPPDGSNLADGTSPNGFPSARSEAGEMKDTTGGVSASFHEWLKAVSPEMTWDWKHQEYIYRHLERVTSGESKRLMIFMPPRHGKSELVTVRYAGWRLWNDPRMRVILTSYNQRLADKFSRSIRRLLSDEEDKLYVAEPPASAGGRDSSALNVMNVRGTTPPAHTGGSASVFPQRMFPKTRSMNASSQWETAVGGGVKAAGVGAGVTGFGAQLIIIDDPVKNRAQAESETLREKVWDWYRNDLYTRLEPNASIVLIQTRWHEDDLAGRLLRDMQAGGDQWEVVNLPALAEDQEDRETGDMRQEPQNLSPDSCLSSPVSADPLARPPGAALCPERFDETKLEEIQRQLGGYAFSALYQQRPTPAGGGIFKRAWFTRFVDAAPKGLRWKRGYDLAVSTKTSACYTSSFRVAYDKLGNLYIADGFRKRIEFPEQRRYIFSRLIEEKDTEHGIEKALHGQAIIQDLRRDPGIRGSNLRGVTVSADKLTRALKWAPLAEEGKVILIRGPWNQAFLDEICNFPGGHFDDQVDAVSLAVAMFQNKGKKLYRF